MGAPLGNSNQTKGKVWREAIRRAVARAGAGIKGEGTPLQKGLNTLANQVIKSALNNERWAIEEIANRLDGKPAQQQILTGIDDGPIQTQDIKPQDTARELAFLLKAGEKAQKETRH